MQFLKRLFFSFSVGAGMEAGFVGFSNSATAVEAKHEFRRFVLADSNSMSLTRLNWVLSFDVEGNNQYAGKSVGDASLRTRAHVSRQKSTAPM